MLSDVVSEKAIEIASLSDGCRLELHEVKYFSRFDPEDITVTDYYMMLFDNDGLQEEVYCIDLESAMKQFDERLLCMS